jgi:hypothetical protein
VNTGVKTQILSGLEHQREIHDEVLTNMSVTHLVSAQLGRLLLQRSCAFVEFMSTALDNVWSEYLSRGAYIQPAEAFLMFCAIMQQFSGNSERFDIMALVQFNKAQWRKGLELPGGTSFKPTGRWLNLCKLDLSSTLLSRQCLQPIWIAIGFLKHPLQLLKHLFERSRQIWLQSRRLLTV